MLLSLDIVICCVVVTMVELSASFARQVCMSGQFTWPAPRCPIRLCFFEQGRKRVVPGGGSRLGAVSGESMGVDVAGDVLLNILCDDLIVPEY